MRMVQVRMWTGLVSVLAAWQGWAAEDVVNIGGRRELFVDDALIAKTSGDLRLVLHRPERKEIVFTTDKPWEGNASSFQSLVAHDGKYRLYYRGGHYGESIGGPKDTPDHRWHAWVLCVAESTDGIHWTRPDLGLCAFKGSTTNNIVLDAKMVASVHGCPAHTSVFYDTNPACPTDQRYKLLVACTARPKNIPPQGIYVMGSGDGYRFRLLSGKPCMTDSPFDTQSVIFWDAVAKTYRAYYRWCRAGKRNVATTSSEDILNFPPGKFIERDSGDLYELYTNQMQPYYRAPHIFLGFPMRYYDRGKAAWEWPAIRALPNYEGRKARYKDGEGERARYGIAVTDAILLAGRDGVKFKAWNEAFIRPGPRSKENWVYGDNFIVKGMIELPSGLEDAPNEINLYSTESYWEGYGTKFRRNTLRLDGFVSAQATASGGELVTKPLIFEGNRLSINFETGGPGELKAELQNPDGTPVPGFALADCFPVFGDHIDVPVSWKGKGTDVGALAGKPVRIRFTLKDADLYAFQFFGK